MSGLWLTPRLATFWKAHPGVAISQIIEDQGRSQGVDLSIRIASEQEKGDTRVLFRDRISLALGTTEFAATHGISDISDLRNVPLIRPVERAGTDRLARVVRGAGRPRRKGRGFL
ncbi:MAG: LysR substrate-binding domain-containing protein [Paracoccaceae bacterium]